jgi:hypothetical protein
MRNGLAGEQERSSGEKHSEAVLGFTDHLQTPCVRRDDDCRGMVMGEWRKIGITTVTPVTLNRI